MNSQIVRLTRRGDEMLRRSGFLRPLSVSVDTFDGFCWVADTDDDQVVHLSGNALEQSRLSGFFGPAAVAADAGDGSCWIADTLNGQVAHIEVTTPAEPTFPDVPFGAFGHDQIDACVAAGIVKGFADGTYQPDLQVTRDQMAVFLARAVAGGDASVPPPPSSASFPDVPEGYWSFKYVEFVFSANIAKGFADGGFHPLDPVDRAQMAAFLARSTVTPTGDEGLAGYVPPTTPTFADVPTSFWAFRYIEFVFQEGAVEGFDDGLFRPTVVVDRAQMAVFVVRAFDVQL
jgi:hypothetical protein